MSDVDYFGEYDKVAQARALGAADQNPDEAARALDLSKASGVPAPVISNDVEGFERDHKAALTAGFLRGNQHLRDYVNSHPLAAAVSGDDWGHLDQLSQSLEKIPKTTAGGVAARSAARGTITAAGTLPFMAAGAEMGAAAGLPLGPVGAVVGGLAGGAVGAIGGSMAV